MLYRTIATPIGELTAEIDGGRIVRFDLAENVPSCMTASSEDRTAADILEREINEYFRGERRTFSLDIAPRGTEFQRLVWSELRKIPYGMTETYGNIAKAIGRAGASRAVGQACHVNHILILIPCHRVVSSAGIGGFALGNDVKKILLETESR